MEEIKIKYNGEYVPLSIFMQSEKFKVIPCTANNQIVYEISNYGNLRSTNCGTGYRGNSFTKTNRCNIIINGGRIRVFTAAIVLNTFLDEEFNPGDHIVYLDGNLNNFRLDNVKKIAAGTALPDMVINTMKMRFPDRVQRKKVKEDKQVESTDIRSSKLLYNAFRQTILNMFAETGIPTPISLLYKNAVESSSEIKNIISLSSFCELIATKTLILGDYGQVFLEPVNSDMVPRIEAGFVSFRLAVMLGELYGDKMSRYRRKYVVDLENSIFVNFTDSCNTNSLKFVYYPAPSYAELIDFLLENEKVFINANYQYEKGVFQGIYIDCETGIEDRLYYDKRYEIALENSIVKYLCDKFNLNPNDSVNAKSEITTENSIETLVNE